MKIVCVDPAGNASEREGYGKTGCALFENGELKDFWSIDSEKFEKQEWYWDAVCSSILKCDPNAIVCESYRLQPGKQMAQTGSSLDTSQLIGYLRMVAWEYGIEWHFQNPSDKIRVSDAILTREGVFEKKGNRYYCLGRMTNDHMRDAVRHGIFFHRYGKGKGKSLNEKKA